jgi:hypothetical protein
MHTVRFEGRDLIVNGLTIKDAHTCDILKFALNQATRMATLLTVDVSGQLRVWDLGGGEDLVQIIWTTQVSTLQMPVAMMAVTDNRDAIAVVLQNGAGILFARQKTGDAYRCVVHEARPGANLNLEIGGSLRIVYGAEEAMPAIQLLRGGIWGNS